MYIVYGLLSCLGQLYEQILDTILIYLCGFPFISSQVRLMMETQDQGHLSQDANGRHIS